MNQAAEFRGDFDIIGIKRFIVVFDLGKHQFGNILFRKGLHSSNHLIENCPKGIDVGADIRFFSIKLFRRQILHRPQYRSICGMNRGISGPGDSKIHQLYNPIARHHDIGWFQITMNYTMISFTIDNIILIVSIAKRSADHYSYRHRHFYRKSTPVLDDFLQGLPIYTLHLYIGKTIPLPDCMNFNNVRMVEFGSDLDFRLETLLCIFSIVRMEEFYRSVNLELRIPYFIYIGHPSDSQKSSNDT